MTERQRENMGISIALMLMLVVLLIAATTELDEATYPVDVNPSTTMEVGP